jgi:serine/arginine repetitive matrix protein 2
MILENLGRIRARNVGSRNTGTEDEGTDSTSTNHQASASQQSFRSSSSTTSVPTSPSGRSTKRYSNNLFGSGRFRDYTYLRSVTQQKRGSTESAKTNFTPAQVSARARADAHNSAPVVSSPQSTPESVSSGTWSPALAAPSSHLEVPTTTLLGGHRLSRNMTPAELHRASMALEEAINEIVEEAEEEFEEAEEEFEEAEEEIVMPRIPNPSRALQPTSNEIEPAHAGASEFEAGMAMTSDAQIIPETDAHMISPVPNSQPETVSPTPRLPGYIPGMPRPMTPRDFDSDGQRSHSTTPRATSPNAHPTNSDRLSPGVSNAGVIRRGSDASTTRRSSRPEATSPSSPMFVPRSTNGRFTPEDRVVARMLSTDVDYMSASAILAARRGAPSPTTATTFQPLAVSSRPGTPSNVIWNVSPNSTTQRSPGHGRHGSWANDSTVLSSRSHISL